MLREKIMEWIGKTFGKPRHEDSLEITYKVSEVNDNKGALVRVEEIGFIFHRIKNSSTEKDVNKWKKELDEITEGTVRGFHSGNEELWGIAGKGDIQRGATKGSLVRGTGILLTVQVHKETFVAKSILFPSGNLSNRRH